MKATSWLNVDEVIVEASDGSYHILPEHESKRWIADFLYWVAGEGKDKSHIADGEFAHGKFTNLSKTYETRPHKKVTR